MSFRQRACELFEEWYKRTLGPKRMSAQIQERARDHWLVLALRCYGSAALCGLGWDSANQSLA